MSILSQPNLRQLMQSATLKTRMDQMQTVKFDRSNIKQVLAESEKVGKGDLDLSSNAILLRALKGDHEEAFELASWSVKAKPASRKTIIASFLGNKQAKLFVHQIGRQKRDDASVLMKDYFAEGGDMEGIAEWLCEAGSILKTGVVPTDTDWGWDSFTSAVGGLVDAVVGAINTVVDAVKTAAKNLGDAIAAVVNWTQSKISDFVESILRAGKAVGEILGEAVKEGTTALTKFVQAVMEAGRRGLEVLNWAVNKTMDVLGAALRKLESFYGSFTTLLTEITKMAVNQLGNMVKGLFAIGKTILDFISRIERFTYEVARALVQEIKKAGKAIGDIIASVINQTRYVMRIVVDALVALGNSINALLREIVNWSVDRVRELIGALKDLGKTLAQALDEIARFVGAVAVKFMKGLMLVWTQLKEVLEFIAQKADSIINTLLTALIGTLIHIKEVLTTILVNVRDAFRKGLIKGLIAIGQSILTLMKEAVKITASAAAVLFTIILDLLGTHRGLTAVERAEVAKVFGSSIELDRIRLTDANLGMEFILWLTSLVKREPAAFTTMYVINFKPGAAISLQTLIHECAHIWQAVNSGGVYMIEALHSQFFGKGYNLTEADIDNAGGKLLNLEREQQAVLVEEFWRGEFKGETITLPLDKIRPLAKQVFKASLRPKPINILNLEINRRISSPALVIS